MPTAGTQLVFSRDVKLGFFARAAAIPASDPDAARRVLNYHLDAFITLFFMAVVAMLVITSAREWWLVLSRRKPPVVHETPLVAPDSALPFRLRSSRISWRRLSVAA